jgi:uridine kinase
VERKLEAMTNPRSPFIISIGGGTGSGKTTLATVLLQRFAKDGACLIEQDSYYRDRSHLTVNERAALNFDDPEALENDLLLRHLENLIHGRAIEKPVYCFETHCRTSEGRTIHPTSVILLEGLFALRDPRVRLLANLKIYVEADADIRFIRRARRDVFERGRTTESVIDQYLKSVRPMHQLHIEPTKAYADLVLHNNGDVAEFLSQIEDVFSVLERKRNGQETS